MTAYILKRLLYSVPVLFCIVLVTFVLMRALPGGPFDRVGDRSLPESVRHNLEAKYRLDAPLHTQFGRYAVDLLRGDLGPSFFYRGRSVNRVIGESLPISLQLGVLALGLALLIGVPAGIVAARNHNSWLDYSSMFVAVLGISLPSIVWGPVLIYFFAIQLGWLPAARWGANYKEFYFGLFPPLTVDYWRHAALPVLTLGAALAATFARLTRASLLQILREDYMRTAHAKGLGAWTVLTRHALKNAAMPLVSLLGPLLVATVTGSFVVERIFGIPGMGEHFVDSVANRDYPLVLGTVLVYSVGLVLANLAVDITYAFLDPRIRYE